MNLAKYMSGLMLLLLFLSCGKGFKNEEIIPEQSVTAKYFTTFKSLNPLVGRYDGWGSISIISNQFWVRLKVNGSFSPVIHPQFIHLNGVCPTIKDDLNFDGFLDFAEAKKKIGSILLPLDGNLEGQIKGGNEFPQMRHRRASYYYSESSDYMRMMKDLRSRDFIHNDSIVKLGHSEDLALHQRVIMIYGVSEDFYLPSTVLSFDGLPSYLSLPIACGEIAEGAINPELMAQNQLISF